jgi:hypothetical protein
VRIREAEYAPRRVVDLATSSAGQETGEYVTWDLRAYWTEDEEPGWIRISQGYWTSHRKGDVPWPEGPYEVLEGAIQRFEGGTMFRLLRTAGLGSTLVLVGRDSRGAWRELTDGPAMAATPASLPTFAVPAAPAGLSDPPMLAPPPSLPDRFAVPATPASLPPPVAP